jgi:hypothetical protein
MYLLTDKRFVETRCKHNDPTTGEDVKPTTAVTTTTVELSPQVASCGK